MLTANLPPRAFATASHVAPIATDVAPFPQGAAASAVLAASQTQLSTPPASLHIRVTPAMTAWLLTLNQPCHDVTMFLAHISAWAVPPGCYARVYRPDPKKYHATATFGICTWWVEALHRPKMLESGNYHESSTPRPGAIAAIGPSVQGAGHTGHYAQVIAVAPDHYWMLVSEMNFHWRGAGFGLVDFRYIHVGAGVSFLW